MLMRILSQVRMQTVQVRLPNSVVIEQECHANVSGRECLEKVCERLGIYETDFFGLKKMKKGASYWLFLRRPLFDQIQKKNARIMLCVKYFVHPCQIQQSTTKRMFYHEMKERLRTEDIHLEDKELAKAGALMCLLEKLTSEVRSGRSAVLTQFFPERIWSSDLSWNIGQQLEKLQGKSEREAMDIILGLFSGSKTYGAYSFMARTVSGRTALLALGSGAVTLYDLNSLSAHSKMLIKDVMEVSYVEKKLQIRSKIQDTAGTHFTIHAIFRSRRQSREIFRCITEFHAYFYQRSVPEGILFHRHKPSRMTLGKGSYLLFDSIRTQQESYAFHWSRLHRVDGDQLQLEDSVISSQGNNTLPAVNESSAGLDISQLRGTTGQTLNDSSLDVSLDALDRSRLSSCKEREHRSGISTKTKHDYCKICYTNRVKTVFCPCGHSVTCISCSKRIQSCPICRKDIAHKQTIFTV